MEVSQEREKEQGSLKGLSVGRPAVVRVCTEWLGTRWGTHPPSANADLQGHSSELKTRRAEHLSRSQCGADDGNKGRDAVS